MPKAGQPARQVKKTRQPAAGRTKAGKSNVMIPGNMRQHTGVFLTEVIKSAQNKYGDPGICKAEDAIVIGIPLPGFSLEYLLQNTVLPLSRIIQIVGLQGSCKSGLAIEITRWFNEYANGIGAVCEHETKWSPDWAMSILNWIEDALLLFPCESVDAWQERSQFLINKMKLDMTGNDKHKGSGRTWPFHLVIDSLLGKSMQETQNKITATGFAGRNFPAEALSITGFMRKLPSDIANWPILVTGINHLKPSKDPTTQALIRHKPGGKGLDFMESFELEVSKSDRGSKIETSQYEGLALNIRCFKNSLGVTNRQIPVDVLWWTEPDDQGFMRQKTVWDWNSSSIKLVDQLYKRSSKSLANGLRDITKLVIDSGRASSKRLGIIKPRPYHEVGAALHADEAIMDELRKYYGIKVRAEFRNDMDYLEQLYGEKAKLVLERKKKAKAKEEKK